VVELERIVAMVMVGRKVDEERDCVGFDYDQPGLRCWRGKMLLLWGRMIERERER
jgi:hypothetical protein